MTRVRSYLFLIYLFTLTPLMGLICAPALWMSDRVYYGALRKWAQLVLGGLRLICGISYKVEGSENLPQGGAVVAANHQSMWETVAIFALLPRPVIVLKKELMQNPVYGVWARRTGVPIDREAGTKAIRLLAKEAEAQIAAGRQLVIFPEGTRVPLGETRKIQPGVAAIYQAAAAPCTPIVHNSGAYWRYPGPLKVPGEIIVKVLPPIAPALNRKIFVSELTQNFNGARLDLAPAQPQAGARAPGDNDTAAA